MHQKMHREFHNTLTEARQILKIAGIFSLCILWMPTAYGQSPKAKTAVDPVGGKADVSRGKYLVENVAMCGQCHTPRDADGNLEQNHWLEGTSVFFQPPSPVQKWPINAPRIGGTPPASDADMIKLLTTGIWTDGKPLRLPMMPFRMSQEDAKAVVAYLRSLNPQ